MVIMTIDISSYKYVGVRTWHDIVVEVATTMIGFQNGIANLLMDSNGKRVLTLSNNTPAMSSGACAIHLIGRRVTMKGSDDAVVAPSKIRLSG